jgi:hypothetical protein
MAATPRKQIKTAARAWLDAFAAKAALPTLTVLVAAEVYDVLDERRMHRGVGEGEATRALAALAQSVAPGEQSHRVATVLDGFVCCRDALGTDWCGVVHGDYLEALLCEQRRYVEVQPPRGSFRRVFRGQAIAHADGRVVVQAIQRTEHQSEHEAFGVLGAGRVVPGFTHGCRRPVEGDLDRWTYFGREVYERNVAALEAEIARRGARGLHVAYALHLDSQGRTYKSLFMLESENAREAREAREADATAPADARRAQPARARSGGRAKRAA